MKRQNTVKFLVLALSLALLIGSVFCIASFAANSGALEIEAINIQHGDRTYVVIAVDAPEDDPETVEVSYTFGGNSYTATYIGKSAIWYETTGDTTEYPIFSTIGIPAKDMGEDIVAEAHVKDSGDKGTERNVSVATYLYQRLYKDGFIEKTDEDGEDFDSKELYLYMLEYGARAQKVLWNNKDENAEAQRTLVTDYIAVYAKDALINGTSPFAVVKESTDVTLTYTGSELNQSGWYVTTYDEAGVGTTKEVSGNTITVTESITATPLFSVPIDPNYEGFEGAYTTTEKTMTSGVSVNNYTFTDSKLTTTYGASYNEAGTSVSVLSENADKYLFINSPKRVNDSDRSVTVTLDSGKNTVFAWGAESSTNVAILEFEYKATGTKPIDTLNFAGLNTTNGYDFGGITIAEPGVWSKVRIEAYKAVGKVQVYVNDVFAGEVDSAYGGSGTTYDRARYAYIGVYNAYSDVTVALDNIYFKHIDKEYVAQEVPAKQATVLTFDEEPTEETVTLSNGDTVSFTQYDQIQAYMDSTSRTNADKASGTFIITDGDNKLFRFYDPGRNASGAYVDTDRAPMLKLLTEDITDGGTANTTVFEFTFNINTVLDSAKGEDAYAPKPFEMMFGNTSGDEVYYQFAIANGKFTIGGLEIGNVNEDVKLKFVYSGHTTDRTASRSIAVYAGDTKVGDLTLDNNSGQSCSTETEIWGRIGTMNRLRFSTSNGSGKIDFTLDDFSAYTSYVEE